MYVFSFPAPSARKACVGTLWAGAEPHITFLVQERERHLCPFRGSGRDLPIQGPGPGTSGSVRDTRGAVAARGWVARPGGGWEE